jgi:ribosomal protein S18 acetylase RimI-like enzyme
MRQVAVDPQYRGQSLGRALVLASETLARSIGVDKLVLHAREVAVPFYLKLDYQIEGDRFVEVGVDHFKMSKAL